MLALAGWLPCRLLVFAILLSGAEAEGFACPDYDSIATPSVAAGKFSLSALAGEWYLVGTSEPTLPAFCTCPKLHWSVDSDDGAIKQYHYTTTAQCLTANFTATMKGVARDPARPGLLAENLAVNNHSIAPYCPHMVYDVQTMPDGNLVGFTYACLLGRGSPVNMFSFNVVSKKPTLTVTDLKSLVAKQNDRTGGLLKVDGIRYSDPIKCGWTLESQDCGNAEYGQCGGSDWKGDSCCPSYDECKVVNEHYSQCMPKDLCLVPMYGQCGGMDKKNLPWTPDNNHQTCCPDSFKCNFKDKYYSQCLFDDAANSTCASPYDQCGGKDWTGKTCCIPGFECSADSDYYSGCKPLPICSNARYGQCGGVDSDSKPWTKDNDHDDCCPEGFGCRFKDQYYSQCTPKAQPTLTF